MDSSVHSKPMSQAPLFEDALGVTFAGKVTSPRHAELYLPAPGSRFSDEADFCPSWFLHQSPPERSVGLWGAGSSTKSSSLGSAAISWFGGEGRQEEGRELDIPELQIRLDMQKKERLERGTRNPDPWAHSNRNLPGSVLGSWRKLALPDP